MDIPATSDNIPGTLVLRDATGKVSTGDLIISGSQKRIRADFSSGPLVERVFFQCINPDGATSVGVIPNGSSNYTNFAVFASNDVDNSPVGILVTEGTYIGISATKTGTGSLLPFTIATGNQERLRIDASGNVGIGTSSPSYRLDIRGGSAGVFNASSDAYIYLGEGTSANEYGFLQWDRTNNLFRIGTDTSGSALVLLTNNAERLRIDASGNVAIGATSVVSEKFEVVGNIAARSNSATGAAGLYNIINGAARSSFGVDMAAAGGAGVSYVDFHRNVFFRDTNSTYETRLQIKPGGQVRFQPLASDPAGAEAGDVYYNSSTNKLKVYNGSSWVDLH